MMQDAMPMMEGRKNARADGWRTGMSKHFLARAEILDNWRSNVDGHRLECL